MAYSPQDVYARHLVSRRGYPLWTPEPNMSLPDGYIREGFRIGDVGVVVPEDGSFDVFFNICLPADHSLHRETGVPNNFTPILLSGRDIAKFPEAESVGRIISTSSVIRVRGTDEPDHDPERRMPGPLNYEFTLSSKEGAVLILPEGAERHHLRNERQFMAKAIREAVDWYTFAEERLGRIISHDSLYLITGFYKACSWSLATYQQGSGTGEASAQFKALQVGGGNIASSYTWETTHAMDWRVGPSNHYYNGIANQTMFIRGFKIAVREGILGMRRINVKADFPSVRTYRAQFSSGSRFSSLWGGKSGSTSGSTVTPHRKGPGTGFIMDTTEGDPIVDESGGICASEDVIIQRFPEVAKPFHPSDIINKYLLGMANSANVVITHDSQWIKLLQMGLLDPGELSQEDRLLNVIRSYNYIIPDFGGACLDLAGTDGYDNDDVITTSIFSERHPASSSMLPDVFTQQSDQDRLATDDASAMLYTCACENIQSAYPRVHTAHETANELREHVKLAHRDVDPYQYAFRCGLPGCGRFFQSVQGLEQHIQQSPAHSQKAPTQIRPSFAGLGDQDAGASHRRPNTMSSEILDNEFTRASTYRLPAPRPRDTPSPVDSESLLQFISPISRGSLGSLLRKKRSRDLDISGKDGEIGEVAETDSSKTSRPRKLMSSLPISGPSTSDDTPFEEHGQARVSCNACQTQGVQCDRALPMCTRCSVFSDICAYDQGTETRHDRSLTPRLPSKGSLSTPNFLGPTPLTDHGKVYLTPCNPCKARKIRCDGVRPNCTPCTRRSESCSYDPDTKGEIKKTSQFTSLPSSVGRFSAASSRSELSPAQIKGKYALSRAVEDEDDMLDCP